MEEIEHGQGMAGVAAGQNVTEIISERNIYTPNR